MITFLCFSTFLSCSRTNCCDNRRFVFVVCLTQKLRFWHFLCVRHAAHSSPVKLENQKLAPKPKKMSRLNIVMVLTFIWPNQLCQHAIQIVSNLFERSVFWWYIHTNGDNPNKEQLINGDMMFTWTVKTANRNNEISLMQFWQAPLGCLDLIWTSHKFFTIMISIGAP